MENGIRTWLGLVEDAPLNGGQFSAWFRGSVVVDDQGQPKRMYHGTGSGDIASFNPEKANAEALYGPGFYFTDSPNVAGGTGDGRDEKDIYTKADWQLAGYAWQGRKYEIGEPLTKKQMAYAKRLLGSRHVEAECREDIGMREGWRTAWRAFQGGEDAFRQYLAGRDANPWLVAKLKVFKELITRPTVFPVFLRITHPFNMDAPADLSLLRTLWDAVPEHHESFENASAGWKNSAHLTGAFAWEWLVKRVLGGDKTMANDVLMRLGYDGIFHTGGFNIGTMGKHAVWIAFRPAQIKSVWSKGFDPRTDQISESSAARPALPKLGETPFWIKPLAKMTRRLELKDWSSGGCFAFADTLASVYKGQRWGVCSSLDGEYPVEHAMVKIGAMFYDFRGAWADPLKTIKSKRDLVMKPASDPLVFWFEDEILDDDDLAILEHVLRTGLDAKPMPISRP